MLTALPHSHNPCMSCTYYQCTRRKVLSIKCFLFTSCEPANVHFLPDTFHFNIQHQFSDSNYIAVMGKVRDDDPAKLTDFKLLSFDVYSTLVDEKGVFLLPSSFHFRPASSQDLIVSRRYVCGPPASPIPPPHTKPLRRG